MATHQGGQPLDLTPLDAVTASDPYPYYARLVRETPFYRDESLNLWVAASASAVEDALANDALHVRPAAEPVPSGIAGTAAGSTFGRFARTTDGEYQRRMKSALNATFERLVWDDVVNAAETCSARFAPHAFGEPGAYERYAYTLPVAVIATLLGVDRDGIERTVQLTADFSSALGASASAESVERGAAAAKALSQRVAGGGPLFTILREEARARDIDEAALVANAVGFLFQSYDATAGLLGNTLVTLKRIPIAGATIADFVKEVARYDAPVHNTRRFAVRETEVRGERIAAGDAILVVLAAANYDPDANDRPERFDPHRSNARVFTFGRAGHACPGERIACATAATGVTALLERGLQPSNVTVRGYRSLPNVRVPQLELATP